MQGRWQEVAGLIGSKKSPPFGPKKTGEPLSSTEGVWTQSGSALRVVAGLSKQLCASSKEIRLS
jgi:hypothetical protein